MGIKEFGDKLSADDMDSDGEFDFELNDLVTLSWLGQGVTLLFSSTLSYQITLCIFEGESRVSTSCPLGCLVEEAIKEFLDFLTNCFENVQMKTNADFGKICLIFQVSISTFSKELAETQKLFNCPS